MSLSAWSCREGAGLGGGVLSGFSMTYVACWEAKDTLNWGQCLVKSVRLGMWVFKSYFNFSPGNAIHSLSLSFCLVESLIPAEGNRNSRCRNERSRQE